MPPAANRSRKRQRPQLATEPHSEATALATTSPNLPTNTDASDEVISESPQYTNMQSHTNDHNNERNFIFQHPSPSSPSFFSLPPSIPCNKHYTNTITTTISILQLTQNI